MAHRDWISTAVEHRGDIAVLVVGGMIDLATGHSLKEAIDGLIGKGLKALIIDLAEVTFMSSIGLAILASTKERLGEAAGFAVVTRSRATSRPVQLTGLDQLFSLHSTLDDAVTDVHRQLNR